MLAHTNLLELSAHSRAGFLLDVEAPAVDEPDEFEKKEGQKTTFFGLRRTESPLRHTHFVAFGARLE